MDQKINKYLKNQTIRPYCNGFKFNDNIKLPAMHNPLDWQIRGLSYTASGYGKDIPTSTTVRFNNRWHRVYNAIYSNVGIAYIKALKSEILLESWNMEYME